MSKANAKILLIEDNPGDAKLVKVLLESNEGTNKAFDLIRVGLLSQALPLLEKGDIMAILLDLGLPDGNGLDSLICIHTAAPTVPIVVLSAEEDEYLAIRAVQLGAQDFLVKHGISGLLLRRSLYYAIERKRLLEQLEHLAHYDVLTGLANRKLFYDRLKLDIISARRGQKPLALMFVDLNDFKLINDSLGHLAGDNLLKEVSKRLIKCVRGSDCVARMGGDEFTVILNSLSSAEDAGLIAEKILQSLAQPFLLDERPHTVHASLGIAIYPDDTNDMEDLIGAADAAMYKAKEPRGGNKSKFCFFSTSMGAKVQRDAEKARQFSMALERGEFELYYQPEVDVHSGRIMGMEALLRWRHPAQGLLTPPKFIHELETSGLIVPVGEWVIGQACMQINAWKKQGLEPLTVSVNISPRQFRHSGFVDSVIDALQKNRLEPACLELEFHEESLWEDEEYAIRKMNRLAQIGVKLSLDNFGRGLVSFKSLTKFPLYAIKIDQSLIQQDSPNKSGAIIARAVIEIARTFCIKGLAEGVETEAQLEMVRDIACNDAQGYLFSHPLPAHEATELIRRRTSLHPRS